MNDIFDENTINLLITDCLLYIYDDVVLVIDINI